MSDLDDWYEDEKQNIFDSLSKNYKKDKIKASSKYKKRMEKLRLKYESKLEKSITKEKQKKKYDKILTRLKKFIKFK